MCRGSESTFEVGRFCRAGELASWQAGWYCLELISRDIRKDSTVSEIYGGSRCLRGVWEYDGLLERGCVKEAYMFFAGSIVL